MADGRQRKFDDHKSSLRAYCSAEFKTNNLVVSVTNQKCFSKIWSHRTSHDSSHFILTYHKDMITLKRV